MYSTLEFSVESHSVIMYCMEIVLCDKLLTNEGSVPLFIISLFAQSIVINLTSYICVGAFEMSFLLKYWINYLLVVKRVKLSFHKH